MRISDWSSDVCSSDLAEARKQMATLVARKVQMLWIYTGGVSDRFLHPREFYWAFGDVAHSELIRLAHWPDCDHTFYTRPHRARLLDSVADWLYSSRSEERRVGQEWVCTWRVRWSPGH